MAVLIFMLLTVLTALGSEPDRSDRDLFLEWTTAQRTAPALQLDHYRDDPTLWSEVAALVVAHENLWVTHVGQSVGGRPMWAFQHGAPDRPGLLVLAGLHAIEWIGTEAALELLIRHVTTETTTTRLAVILVANPDGRARVAADLANDRSVMRRGNGAGVDLNRDWAVHRTAARGLEAFFPRRLGLSPSALSQPETRAIAAFAENGGFTHAASLHAWDPHGMILLPWAGHTQRPASWQRLKALGASMQSRQQHPYALRQLGRLVPCVAVRGTELDHLHGLLGLDTVLIEISHRDHTHRTQGTRWFRRYNPMPGRRDREETVAALEGMLDALEGSVSP